MSSKRVPLPDLTTCDREPITRLDRIQNFGFLVALSNDWTIIRVSANLGFHLGVDAASALGGSFGAAIEAEAKSAILSRIARLNLTGNERLFGIRLVADRPLFDLNLHFIGDILVIEGEPSRHEDMNDAVSTVRAMIALLVNTPSIEALQRMAARQLREITGFDRVMVYRFDADQNGEIVAEATGPGIESFLGLHYPASDIPQQARALYIRNPFRIISDVGETPVALLPAVAINVPALDLSQSITRAVSTVHIEYLTNMGVGATLSISIIVGGELWGLFACHHYGPRLPSFVIRTAAAMFGAMYSLSLESRLGRAAAAIERRAHLLTDTLIAGVAGNENLLSDPEWLHHMISEVVEYDGLAVCRAGEVMCLGSVPSDAQINLLAKHLNLTSPSRVFTTDHLTSLSALNGADPERAAGVLAIPISRTPRDYILLFRREWQQSIKWGGEPGKLSAAEDGLRLSPRKSFAAFSQTIRGKSRPFSDSDRRIGEAMRSAMIEVILRLSAVSMAALAAEVEVRRRVERAMFGLNEQFEAKVVAQTRELIEANSRLANKIVAGAAALKSSRAEVGSGRADLLASKTALASSQAETRVSAADLLLSVTHLAASRAETKVGVADLLASTLALAASRAETKISLADLVIGALDLAASRAEIKAGESQLHDSEDANRILAEANEVLVINEVALEKLVAQRTTALRAEINTRRIMATAIAHELNQPLAAVSSYLTGVALLAERGDTTADTLAMIAEGSRQAAKNAVRAGSILKLLRNSITRDDTAVTVEDIVPIIEETLAAAAVDANGLDITFGFDRSVTGMSAMVNRTQIRQVLANLIQNAVEAVTGMPRREVIVTVGKDPASRLLTIEVADTGPGIPPEQLKGLFMPFVSNKPHGMGIGLSISREIVEQHGGRLTTRENPAGGALFSLVLPLGDGEVHTPGS